MQYNIWETAPTFITTGSSQSPTHFGKKKQAISLWLCSACCEIFPDFFLESSAYVVRLKNAKGDSTFDYLEEVFCDI